MNLRPTDVPARACMFVTAATTPPPPAQILYVKLSGYIASRRHAPSPCTDILPITLNMFSYKGRSLTAVTTPPPPAHIFRVIWKCVEILKRIYKNKKILINMSRTPCNAVADHQGATDPRLKTPGLECDNKDPAGMAQSQSSAPNSPGSH